jgi:hypothetical protein
VQVKLQLGALRLTQPHEYAIRFFFGGIVTALTGLLAHWFGPALAGLFLAFPAICRASVTLIAKHERKKKEKFGMHGIVRGKNAAAVDAAGTALGCVGLAAFGAVIWRGMPRFNASLVLMVAMLVWLAVSTALWQIRKRM